DESYDGSEENEEDGHGPAGEKDGADAGGGDGGASVSAHERVRGAAGNAEADGGVVPDDGAEESGEKDVFVDEAEVNEAFAHGGGDGGAVDERGDEVPECSPDDGPERRENARGDDAGNGAGGIVPAIGEVEDQAYGDDDEEEVEAGHERALVVGGWRCEVGEESHAEGWRDKTRAARGGAAEDIARLYSAGRLKTSAPTRGSHAEADVASARWKWCRVTKWTSPGWDRTGAASQRWRDEPATTKGAQAEDRATRGRRSKKA